MIGDDRQKKTGEVALENGSTESTPTGISGTPESSSETQSVPETEEQQEKSKVVGRSKRERLKLKTAVELQAVAGEEKEATGPIEKVKGFFKHGIEWIKEKFKGSRNSFVAMFMIVLDHAMDYVKPDENGGTQSRTDLLGLADKLVDGTGTAEEKLKELERDRMMLHKNNLIETFSRACQSGKSLEFDMRWSGKEIVIRHNRDANEPEITLDQYIEIMKNNPGWNGRMELDVKDRTTISQLSKYIAKMPDNFRAGLMIGTFDPEFVMQVHETLNKDAAEENRIPIILHVFPLMRYDDTDRAKAAVKGFNDNKGWIAQVAKATINDVANDPQASIATAKVYTTYEDFKNTDDPNAEHLLALENPIEEIMEKDRRVLDAILFSGGEFSFPYDPKFLQWIKDNADRTGVNFSNVGVGTWHTSSDDLYDALSWQDNAGNRISRISVDSENV